METELVELKTVAHIIMGQSPPSDFYNEIGEGLPFYQGKTEFGDYHPTIKQFSTSGNRIAEKGDILFTVRAPVGELNIATTKCIIGRGLASIRAKEISEQNFLFYAIKVYQPVFLSRAFGAVYDAINKKDLHTSKLTIPKDRNVRLKISSILSAYDDLIENNFKSIKLLEEMAQITFDKWFAKRKGMPNNWKETNLGSLVGHEIGGGWGEESKSKEFSEAAFVIRGTDMSDIPLGKLEDVPFRFHKKSNLASRKLQDGDIVFEVSGGSTYEGVAKTLLITDELLMQFKSDVMCASFCKLLRPESRELSNFIFLFLRFLRAM